MRLRNVAVFGSATPIAGSFLASVFVIVAVATSDAGANDPGQYRPATRDEICGTQLLHSDGTYETGVINQHDWIEAPEYGAFAERFEFAATVCAVVLDLSQLFSMWEPDPFDVFVWQDDGYVPGAVLSMEHVQIGNPPNWPMYRRYRFELATPCQVEDRWWVGYWSPSNALFVCADEDGPGGGRPMTKVRPGIGYPSGWQDIDIMFFPVAALGIGAEILPEPTPARESTWGRVKSLYR